MRSAINYKEGKCSCCRQSHSLANCPTFKILSSNQKLTIIRRDGICCHCLAGVHAPKDCKFPKGLNCGIEGCLLYHNPIPHGDASSVQVKKLRETLLLPPHHLAAPILAPSKAVPLFSIKFPECPDMHAGSSHPVSAPSQPVSLFSIKFPACPEMQDGSPATNNQPDYQDYLPPHQKVKGTRNPVVGKTQPQNATPGLDPLVPNHHHLHPALPKNPVKYPESSAPPKDGCPICEEPHNLTTCDKFLEMPVLQRLSVVIKCKICIHCLLARHVTSKCIAKDKLCCGVDNCRHSHHKLLHKPASRKPPSCLPKRSAPPKDPVKCPIPSLLPESSAPPKDWCPICEEPHDLTKCKKFQEMSYDQRLVIIRLHKICFYCLSASHITSECKRNKKIIWGINNCPRNHHKLLHKNVSLCMNAH